MRESCATGLWNAPGVPHKGWICTSVEDLEQPSAICQMCLAAEIRYAHCMKHQDYPQKLMVGCICAEHMAEGYDGKAAEKVVRTRSRRLAAWSAANWKESKSGSSIYRKTGDGFVVIVFWNDHSYRRPIRGDYGYCIKRNGCEEALDVDGDFYTEEEAKREAFASLEYFRLMDKRRPAQVEEDDSEFVIYNEEASGDESWGPDCARCGRVIGDEVEEGEVWKDGPICAECLAAAELQAQPFDD